MDTLYCVVVNDEEQYSIWPKIRDLPSGWRMTGFEGGEQVCLDHIGTVWPDIRPLSVRRALGEGKRDAEPS